MLHFMVLLFILDQHDLSLTWLPWRLVSQCDASVACGVNGLVACVCSSHSSELLFLLLLVTTGRLC